MMAQRSSCGEDSSSLDVDVPPLVARVCQGLGGAWDARMGAFRRSETDLRQYRDMLEPTSNGSSFSPPRHNTPIDPVSAKTGDYCSRVPVSAAHAQRSGCDVSPCVRPACRALATVNFMRGFKLRMSQAHYFPSHPLPHNCLGAVAPLSFFSSLFIVLLSEPALVVPFCLLPFRPYIL